MAPAGRNRLLNYRFNEVGIPTKVSNTFTSWSKTLEVINDKKTTRSKKLLYIILVGLITPSILATTFSTQELEAVGPSTIEEYPVF